LYRETKGRGDMPQLGTETDGLGRKGSGRVSPSSRVANAKELLMRDFLCRTIFLLLLFVTVGCGSDKKQLAAGGVAVVNLKAVAVRLGRANNFQQAFQDKQADVKKQLEEFRKSLNDDYNRKVVAYGEQPTNEQKQELRTLQGQLTIKLNQQYTQLQQELKGFVQDKERQFREQIKPIARVIAQERGLSIVVNKDDNLILSFEAAVDITEDVIGRMADSSAESAKTKPK